MYNSLESKFEPVSIKLNPVTSLSTSRYDGNSARIELLSQAINKGPPSRSNINTPSHKRWEHYIHPEGQPYFVQNTEFDFAVVTEACVDDAQIEGRILDCTMAAHKELLSTGIKLPPRCELFLELGDDCLSCNYYFVDHVGKALFWLEDVCTGLLGIPAAMSPSHLETALQRLYWVHVEFFPMHHDSYVQDFTPIVEELYNIMSHGQADRLTSRTSTFPYTVDTCSYFLRLLEKKRGQRVDGYTLCYAARLVGAIMNQRFLTFYGQRSAQLDRLQEMYPSDAVQEHKWLSAAADVVLWGIPQHYNRLLEDLYVNEQVYVDQWTGFITVCLADWMNSISWSFPVFIASILLSNVRGGTPFMAIPSGLSCAVSIASASCLHLRHQPLLESTATFGARYLHLSKTSRMGFIPLSIALSLPRAGCLWGIGFLTAQFLLVSSHNVNRLIVLSAASIVAAILMFVIRVVYPEEADSADSISLYRLLTTCIPWLHAVSGLESDGDGDVSMA